MLTAGWLKKFKGTVALDVQCQDALDVHAGWLKKKLKAQWL
jgi:hypothetical protein